MRINIDIKKFPTKIEPLQQSMTLGDAHGNSVFILYWLIQNSVVTLKEKADYEKFVQAHKVILEMTQTAYALSHDSYKGGLSNFDFDKTPNFAFDPARAQEHMSGLCSNVKNKKRITDALDTIGIIIDNATVTTQKCIIRFIGDMLADRGYCDYPTLLLLQKLHAAVGVEKNTAGEVEKNIDVRILYSNHDKTLVEHYKFSRDSKFNFNPEVLGLAQQASLQTMIAFLEHGMLDPDKINGIISECYLPKLKLIDISDNPVPGHSDRLRFYTHAPAGKNELNKLAKAILGDQQKEFSSHAQFRSMVGDINNHFQQFLMRTMDALKRKVADAAIHDFVWTRAAKMDEGWRDTLATLGLECFHGHDGLLNVKNGDLNHVTGQIQLDGLLQNIAQILYDYPDEPLDARRQFVEREFRRVGILLPVSGPDIQATGSGGLAAATSSAGMFAGPTTVNTTPASSAAAAAAASPHYSDPHNLDHTFLKK